VAWLREPTGTVAKASLHRAIVMFFLYLFECQRITLQSFYKQKLTLIYALFDLKTTEYVDDGREAAAKVNLSGEVQKGSPGSPLDVGKDGGAKVLPFEFRALEVCLESACKCLESEVSVFFFTHLSYSFLNFYHNIRLHQRGLI